MLLNVSEEAARIDVLLTNDKLLNVIDVRRNFEG